MQLLSWKEEGRSVAISMPRICTALASRPLSTTKSSEASTAAAPPSEVGQHCSLVSGEWTMGAACICSRLYSSCNHAHHTKYLMH